MFLRQAARVGLGLAVLLAVAQVPPRILRAVAPWLYALGVLLLVAVALVGDVAMGAQRWLDLGFIRFQPSELMKIAVPLACAWFLHDRPLPPDLRSLVVLGVAILVPVLLIAEQPDLGTALLVAAGGGLVVLLAGLQLRYMVGPRRAVRRGRAGPVALPARLPAPARAHLPQPAERPARRRLPHHPVADRDRLRRRVRQGLHERQPGAPRVPAGAFHRLHLRGDRRGVGPGGTVGADRAVPVRARPAASTSRRRRRTRSRD